jgi:hypothetical protein
MLIGLLLTAFTLDANAQIATTQVTDTIYHADGTTATGTVLISWPAFTTSFDDSILSGSTSATIATGGVLSVQLIANAGATPMGSYYTVVYHLDDGSISRQYWVVPASSAPVRISAIESTVLPTSVAMQTVSKSYVDTAITAAVAGHPLDSMPYVLKSGDTMTGPLILDDVSTQSEATLFQQTGSATPGSAAVTISQQGFGGGSNLFPEQIDSPVPYFKMNFSALTVNGTYNTQGHHVLVPQAINCYGVGDCLMGARTIVAAGGIRDTGDEGAHPFDLQTHEDSNVFTGTCATGCTTGSTTLMITPTAGPGTQGDGRFLIDTNPARSITSASTHGTLISGSGSASGPHATAHFSGTSFTVSTLLSLGQAIPSQTNNIAPGTVTFVIATTGVPAGYATSTAAIGNSSGVACAVDQTAGTAPDNYEMAPYTVVDATHLQMTFNKPHQLLASLAFGGLCGYGLEQTVDTASGIRQLFPVLGATSATSLYYAGGSTPVVGVMSQTSGFLNVSAAIASATRTGGIVTMTTTGNLAANIGGLTITIAGVADSSYDGNYLVTTTGTNSFTYAQSGANSSSSGGIASVLTGGFALYPMAEVLSVFDAATNSVDGQMTLAPNNVAWSASDPVEEPHFYQEYVTADTEMLGQFLPRPSVAMRAGLQYQQNNGPGLIGWSIANAAPASNYLGYGGTHTAPDGAYEATGVWRRTMNLAAGEQAVFAVHCNLHGCGSWNSVYNLFELDSSAGVDTVAYSPASSSLTLDLRGTPYSFTPQAFTAGTINVGTLNATTINGVSITGSGGAQIAGDLGGTNASPLVTGIQGKAVSATAPTAGQALVYSGALYVPRSVATTITLEHAFTGAGTFNYTHSLGTSYPLMTCYVNSGSPAYAASNVDANNIAITVTASSDITCTFGI